jgi:hypothetical protein
VPSLPQGKLFAYSRGDLGLMEQLGQSVDEQGLFDEFGEAFPCPGVAGVFAEPEGGEVAALELFQFPPVERELVAEGDQRCLGERVDRPQAGAAAAGRRTRAASRVIPPAIAGGAIWSSP